MVSCLGGWDDDYTFSEKTALIKYIQFSHDDIPELSSIFFYIDQANGEIYNLDSIPYGSNVIKKMQVDYTANITGGASIIQSLGDSITTIISGDSIYILPNMEFDALSYDQTIKKNYKVTFNVHKVDPDSVHYVKIADNLDFLAARNLETVLINDKYYTFTQDRVYSDPDKRNEYALYESTDLVTWNALVLEGFPADADVRKILKAEDKLIALSDGELYQSYNVEQWTPVESEYPVAAILGYLKKSHEQEGGIAAVVEKDGENVFAFSSDLQEWTYGTVIPDNFPYGIYESVSYNSMFTERITLVGEKNDVTISVWNTTNGLYWANVYDGSTDKSLKILNEDFNLFYYDDELYLMNGVTVNGINEVVYSSSNGGLKWEKSSKLQFPSTYSHRRGASLVLDKEEKYFYILGGLNVYQFTDVWKCYKNKKLF